MDAGGADRTYRMDDVLAGKIECRGDLCPSGGFILSLGEHELGAGIAQLQTGSRVDLVIDTAMTRTETAK